LIRGELIEMAPAGGAHGEIAAGIIGRLWAHVTENKLGRVYTSETGFVLAREPDVVHGPDAAVVRSERVPARQRGFYEVAPDLTVEVMSPDDSYHYVHGKVMEYLEAGVRLVWVVDPERQTITVYQADRSGQILTIDDALDGGDVLPGFTVPVARIFE
jgi:Uma2 family endonuclease